MQGRHPTWSTAALLGLLVAGAVAPGCAPDRRRITPTTTGSDMTNLPRGRMTPLPFPGSSLASRDRPARDRVGSTVDPAAATAAAAVQTSR